MGYKLLQVQIQFIKWYVVSLQMTFKAYFKFCFKITSDVFTRKPWLFTTLKLLMTR